MHNRNNRNTVRLSLHDGETLTIAARDVARVWENLWSLRSDVDAMIVAGVVIAVSREFSGHSPLELSGPQSALIRKAVAQPEAA